MSSKKSFYIPAGMTVTGTFTVDVPGQIAGAVNGDVFVNGRLAILKNAVIKGNVTAHEIEVLGRVTGDIICSGKINLQNDCYVKGNISTIEIQMEKDAVVHGIITKKGLSTEAGIDNEATEETGIETQDEPVLAIEEPILIRVEDDKVQSWF